MIAGFVASRFSVAALIDKRERPFVIVCGWQVLEDICKPAFEANASSVKVRERREVILQFIQFCCGWLPRPRLLSEPG